MDRTTFAYRAASAVARALPARGADAAARVVARAMAGLDAPRRAQVERNLRRVHGRDLGRIELHRAVVATFESNARYYLEAFRLPGTPPDVLDAGLVREGYEHLADALEGGRGAIVALPHLGGWEWAGFWAAAVARLPISVVVEALEPPELFEWFAGLRESLGMHVIPLGPEAGAEVVRALKAGHIVCLLCDRDIGGGGVEVDFFGERTRLPAGPATLALRTGAPVLPTAVYVRDGRHVGVIRPPVDTTRHGKLRDDVVRITQAIAGELEELIRAAPDQWHLLQPNWPSDPGYR